MRLDAESALLQAHKVSSVLSLEHSITLHGMAGRGRVEGGNRSHHS